LWDVHGGIKLETEGMTAVFTEKISIQVVVVKKYTSKLFAGFSAQSCFL